MSDRVMNIGVIGLSMGKHHLYQFKKCEKAKIFAICDVNKERLTQCQKEFNVPYVFEDYRKLIDTDELDAVVVAVPNFLHASVTILALKSGKHVLCEKPMAMNAKQAEEMIKISEVMKKKLMIHFNQRFTPESRFLKSYIDKGELGNIYYVKSGWLRRRGLPLSGWFTTKSQSGGGALIDIGVHMLDLSLWFMGFPKPLSVSSSTYTKFGKSDKKKNKIFDVDDLACAFIKFKNGASLFLEVSWASNIKQSDYIYSSVLGDKGGAERIQSPEHTIEIYKEKEGNLIDIKPKVSENLYESSQQHFVDCIMNNKKPMSSCYEALEVQRILDAIYKSAESKKEVKLKWD